LSSSPFYVVAQCRVVTNQQQHKTTKIKKTNVVASALHNNTAAFAINYSDNEELQHLYSLFNITVLFK
jgi:hypothetical protein